MASNFHKETNQQLEDGYYDQDEDDLGDFIVYSEEDEEPLKHKHLRQEELEDDMELEVEQEEEVEHQEEVEEIEEEEEEDAPVGQQEILSLREQLKEKIRRKNAAMAGSDNKSSCSSYVKQRMMPPSNDGYGTFFGPSKPVLARRVIEEGFSSVLKEQQNVPSRRGGQLVSKAHPGAVENMQKPKFVSEEKRKVDALRENRDYSSLFSDDADTPQPTKKQPDKSSTLKSESYVREPVKSTGQPARLSSIDYGLKAAARASVQARVQSKAGSLGKDPLADRRRMIAAGRTSSIQSNMKKRTPGSQPSSNNQKMQPSIKSKRPLAPIPGQRQQQPASQGQRMQQQSQSQRPQGNGRQQSSQGRRSDPSVQGQIIRQNGSAELHGRLKSAQKQLGSSKLKASRAMENGAVKRKSDDCETVNYSSMIREMFPRYRPEKFVGRDDDDRNMVAHFSSIEKEERRSAVLARKEDEEQFCLIQEEERRERAMKRRKAAPKE